jgi:hypothetical protein
VEILILILVKRATPVLSKETTLLSIGLAAPQASSSTILARTAETKRMKNELEKEELE